MATSCYEDRLVLNENVKELTGATFNEQHEYLLSLRPAMRAGSPPLVPDAAFAKLWLLQLEAVGFFVETPEAYRAAYRWLAPTRRKVLNELVGKELDKFVEWLLSDLCPCITLEGSVLKHAMQWRMNNPELANKVETQGSKSVAEIIKLNGVK